MHKIKVRHIPNRITGTPALRKYGVMTHAYLVLSLKQIKINPKSQIKNVCQHFGKSIFYGIPMNCSDSYANVIVPADSCFPPAETINPPPQTLTTDVKSEIWRGKAAYSAKNIKFAGKNR